MIGAIIQKAQSVPGTVRYFSIQYSPSVSTPLVPILKSVCPEDRSVPRMPLNFPVPPVSVTTFVNFDVREPSAAVTVCMRTS